jgi:hypothetical protein
MGRGETREIDTHPQDSFKGLGGAKQQQRRQEIK